MCVFVSNALYLTQFLYSSEQYYGELDVKTLKKAQGWTTISTSAWFLIIYGIEQKTKNLCLFSQSLRLTCLPSIFCTFHQKKNYALIQIIQKFDFDAIRIRKLHEITLSSVFDLGLLHSLWKILSYFWFSLQITFWLYFKSCAASRTCSID